MRSGRFLAAAAAAVLLLPAAPGRAADPAGRPAAVLALLAEVAHGPMAPHEATGNFLLFVPRREEVPEAAGTRRVTAVPPGCGLTEFEPLPRDRAAAVLRRLFRIYGFEAAGPVDLRERGVEARLDGWDGEKRVGFKFVRSERGPPGIRLPGNPAPAPEPAAEALSPEEIGDLARGGARVLPVPADRLVGHPRDPFTPLFTALLDAVEFLDGATGGPGLDLRNLAGTGTREIPLPDFDEVAFAGNDRFVPSKEAFFFVLEERRTLRLEVSPPAVPAPRRPAPSLLVLPFHWLPPYGDGGYDFSGPAPAFLLTQGVGKEAVAIRSGRALFVLPPAFDPGKPFRVDIDLPPGQVNLARAAVLRVPGDG